MPIGARAVALNKETTRMTTDGHLSRSIALLAAILAFSAATASAAGNLALGRPATASSVEAGTTFTAANAVDGVATTRWGSSDPAMNPEWIYVDLGAAFAIGRVVLNWEAAYAKSYQMQTSNDTASWTTIYSTTTGAGGVENLTVAGSGRYVRMLATVRGTAYG